MSFMNPCMESSSLATLVVGGFDFFPPVSPVDTLVPEEGAEPAELLPILTLERVKLSKASVKRGCWLKTIRRNSSAAGAACGSRADLDALPSRAAPLAISRELFNETSS